MAMSDYGKCGEEVTRKAFAWDVLDLVCSLAQRAETLADEMEHKLAPIMRVQPPLVEAKPSGEVREEYPQYFEQMKDRLNVISRSLKNIESYLQRTEI